jgi:hypothetical protein
MGRREACIEFWCGNLKKRDHFGDPGVDGRTILGRIYRKWDVGCMDWIGLAQGRDIWQEIVNVVMNHRVP